jgi:hypothetical protein
MISTILIILGVWLLVCLVIGVPLGKMFKEMGP